MKCRKLVVATTAALVALSFSVTAFAATQTRTGTRDQIKDGSCIKKYLAAEATQTRDQIKDGTCVNK